MISNEYYIPYFNEHTVHFHSLFFVIRRLLDIIKELTRKTLIPLEETKKRLALLEGLYYSLHFDCWCVYPPTRPVNVIANNFTNFWTNSLICSLYPPKIFSSFPFVVKISKMKYAYDEPKNVPAVINRCLLYHKKKQLMDTEIKDLMWGFCPHK